MTDGVPRDDDMELEKACEADADSVLVGVGGGVIVLVAVDDVDWDGDCVSMVTDAPCESEGVPLIVPPETAAVNDNDWLDVRDVVVVGEPLATALGDIDAVFEIEPRVLDSVRDSMLRDSVRDPKLFELDGDAVCESDIVNDASVVLEIVAVPSDDVLLNECVNVRE